MLTLKKEKGKQKHPNEKITREPSKWAPSQIWPAQKNKRNHLRKTERARKWAPSHRWPEKKGPWGEARHPGTHAMPQ